MTGPLMADPTKIELLTIPETAALLRLKVSTIRAWLLQRRVPCVKLDRLTLLRRADIQALLDASVVPAETEDKELEQVLTPTECTVFPLLQQGLQDKQIATELGKGLGTIKAHVRSILKKLNKKS